MPLAIAHSRYLRQQELYLEEQIAIDPQWLQEHRNMIQNNENENFIVNPEDQPDQNEGEAENHEPTVPMEMDEEAEEQNGDNRAIEDDNGNDASAEHEEGNEEQNANLEEEAEGGEQVQNPANEDAEEEWDETVNDTEPLNPGAEETIIQDNNDNEIDRANMAIEYAPGENNRPIGLLFDRDGEFRSFPKIYCGRRMPRPRGVTYGREAKHQIRHRDRRWASRPDVLLYKMGRLVIEQVAGATRVVLRQVRAPRGRGRARAGQMLDRNFVNELVQYDAGKKQRPSSSMQKLMYMFSFARLQISQRNSLLSGILGSAQKGHDGHVAPGWLSNLLLHTFCS